MTARPSLSVIIPARPHEPALPDLLALLNGLDGIDEILVRSDGGRAASLNAGAKEARGDLLWFLHADSRPGPDCIERLRAAHARAHGAVLYFDLEFEADAAPFTRLNQAGGNLRSRLLRLPFGDQGLACSRAVFEVIGPYRTDAAYGEDHLLIWSAHRHGVPVRPVGAALRTSARTYREHGWLRLTLLYQYRWIAQAAPQFLAMLRDRRNRGQAS